MRALTTTSPSRQESPSPLATPIASAVRNHFELRVFGGPGRSSWQLHVLLLRYWSTSIEVYMSRTTIITIHNLVSTAHL